MLNSISLAVASLLVSLSALYAPHQTPAQTKRPIVIAGATIIDGSGRPGFRASLRIEGDRIARIGRVAVRRGDEVVDARGMILAPGFIDIHNHSERGLNTDPGAKTQVSQGITTIVIGADGGGPWPVGDYLSRRAESRAAVNLITFIGHATVRQRVMGRDYKRPATEEEIFEMKRLVEQAMREGAAGLSTGLEYDVGHPSTTEEVIELARVAARHGGIYMSHIRDEADLVMDALKEAIRIGREARIPVHISHIKMGTVGVWGKSREAVALIDLARKSGVDVTADCYPYTAWASTITVLVPSRRHEDPVAVEKGIDDVGGASKVLITSCAAHSDFEGLTLEEAARRKGISPVEAYIRIVKDGGASVVCSSMQESDVHAFYRQPWVMVASDGGIGLPHPRSAGSFPRVLGRFVRERRWLSLEEAIRKMTSAPAARLGLKDRGMISEGMKADLVLFDSRRVIDRSTFKDPQMVSEGIGMVFVNGEMVWDGGKTTGRLSGAVIRIGRE